MKLAEFTDSNGMNVLIAVDAIRIIRPSDTGTVKITFEREHTITVKGSLHDVLTALRNGIET